jgi:hypothetical protein
VVLIIGARKTFNFFFQARARPSPPPLALPLLDARPSSPA